MVCKCFCDKCGKESEELKTIKIEMYKSIWSDEYIRKHYCEKCFRLMRRRVKELINNTIFVE